MFPPKAKKQQKILAYAVILSMQLNTLTYAASVVVPDRTNGKNPGVSRAANGVQVVDIRLPNGRGLSHNQYTNLQVDKEGLIFNNTGQIAKTQLAGYINGNIHLAGNISAKAILNEVTGKIPTSLNGYMEIAGNRADLVIANPNGIVGNNFGYINTGRAVLTTGKPFMGPEGDLRGLSVFQGSVAVEGLGLDGRTTHGVDIYARAVKINAGVWGPKINVITGSNDIAYPEGKVTKVISDADRGISLDVAALGGMYAEKIILLGTAKGLGVNMEGNIHGIGAEVIVNQKGDIINKGKLYATSNTIITTDGKLHNSGIINSGTVKITASDGNIDNTGTIYGDDITLKADTLNNLSGAMAPVIAARQNMNIEANLVNNKEHAILTAGQDMTIKAGAVNNNSATIEAGRNMSITADSLNNTNEHFATAVKLVKKEDIQEVQAKKKNYRLNLKDYTYDFSKKYHHREDPSCQIYYQKHSGGSYALVTPLDWCLDWYRYEYRRTTKEDVVVSTDPGKITAGKNLAITGGTVTNDKSLIHVLG